MAAYDYACRVCGRTETVTRSVHDPSEPRIPCDCGATLRRVYTPTAATFRGTGWAGKAPLPGSDP